MSGIKRRKLWPFQNLTNRAHFGVWVLGAIAVWLMWLYKTKLRIINTPIIDNAVLFRVTENTMMGTEIIVKNGTLFCENFRLDNWYLASKFVEGGFLMNEDTGMKFTDSVVMEGGVDDKGQVRCKSVTAAKIQYGDMHPLVTTDEKCTINVGNAVTDFLVHTAKTNEIVPLSNLGRNLATFLYQYNIKKYGLPLMESHQMNSQFLTISHEIVEASLPKHSLELLYVTASGELKSLPLPTSTETKLLRATTKDKLDWFQAPPGAWFTVIGSPKAGDIMFYEGGSHVSFRKITDRVTTGNVRAMDIDVPLDTSSLLPPLVQFDNVYGRVRRIKSMDKPRDDSTIECLYEIPNRTRLDKVEKFPWINEQKLLFEKVSLPPQRPLGNSVSWVFLSDSNLRCDLLQAPKDVREKVLLGSNDEQYGWIPVSKFVLAISQNEYDAQSMPISGLGAPTQRGEAVRLGDLENCVKLAGVKWEMAGYEVHDLAPGTDSQDAVTMEQCQPLFGLPKLVDHYDAQDTPIINVLGSGGNAKDGLIRTVAIANNKKSRSWVVLEYGFKTTEEILITFPYLTLMSHHSVANGYPVPLASMSLKYACLYTPSTNVTVEVITQNHSESLMKTSLDTYQFFKIDRYLDLGSIIKCRLISEEGGVQGIERCFQLVLFVTNAKEFGV